MELFTGNGDEVKMMMMNIIRLMTIIMMTIMRIIFVMVIDMLIALIMMIMMVIIPRELFDYYQAGGLETAEELEVLFNGKQNLMMTEN